MGRFFYLTTTNCHQLRRIIVNFLNRLASFFCRTQGEEWDFKNYHRVFERQLAECIEEAELENTEIESLVQNTMLEAVQYAASTLLKELKRTAPIRLREQRTLKRGFQARTFKRWKDGLDLLNILLVVSFEVGSKYNELNRPSAVENNDYRFEALVNLHARALRVAHEIHALLLSGFPDGALSRWRTLHEIAVIMTFLRYCDPIVSERFVVHRQITEYKAIKQYREYQDRANLEPIEDSQYEAARETKESIIEDYGSEMTRDYGWAALVLNAKNPSLLDLETHVGLDHWRPRFKWACDDIHGGYRPVGTSLGESEACEPLLLAGASNSAFTDPAHMMAISLDLANHALLLDDSSIDLLVISGVLRTLTDEVGETFLRIDIGTGQPSED